MLQKKEAGIKFYYLCRMPDNLHKAVLLFGSNLGDRKANLIDAAIPFANWSDGQITKSSIYASPSWGDENQPDYLNQVVMFETWLDAEELLFRCLEVEQKLGRIRSTRYASRTIDIDILFFDDLILDMDNLTIPHSQIEYRKFTLLPLCELIPGFIHPVSGKDLSTLLDECIDRTDVIKMGDN